MPFTVKEIVRTANTFLYEKILSVQTIHMGLRPNIKGGFTVDKTYEKRWRYKAKRK